MNILLLIAVTVIFTLTSCKPSNNSRNDSSNSVENIEHTVLTELLSGKSLFFDIEDDSILSCDFSQDLKHMTMFFPNIPIKVSGDNVYIIDKNNNKQLMLSLISYNKDYIIFDSYFGLANEEKDSIVRKKFYRTEDKLVDIIAKRTNSNIITTGIKDKFIGKTYYVIESYPEEENKKPTILKYMFNKDGHTLNVDENKDSETVKYLYHYEAKDTSLLISTATKMEEKDENVDISFNIKIDVTASTKAIENDNYISFMYPMMPKFYKTYEAASEDLYKYE